MKVQWPRFIRTAVTLAGLAGCTVRAEDPPIAKVASAQVKAEAPVAGQSMPNIQFRQADYDFGRVKSGTPVKYDFVFTNTGTAPLEINDVQFSCGCTTAGAWSKLIQPGQAGNIPIRLDTAQLAGFIHKTVTVCSNASNFNPMILNIIGTVWREIDVTPDAVYFCPPVDSQKVESKLISIVNNMEEPLELVPPECVNPAFAVELRTIKKGRKFELRVSAKPPFEPGTLLEPISIKTSSKNLPVVTIRAYIMAQLPFMAMPSQIMLGASPLAAPVKFTVTLRNTGTTAVTFFDPTVNAPGVAATIQEIQPGRVFSVTLDFPSGFEAKFSGVAQLTVKSSHQQYPVIKVPIVQSPQEPDPGIFIPLER